MEIIYSMPRDYKIMENVKKEMSTYIKQNDVFYKTNKYNRKILKLTNTDCD